MLKWRFQQLIKRLAFLGYGSFEIKIIIQNALGGSNEHSINYSQLREVIRHLEQYEQLGSDFVEAYSK